MQLLDDKRLITSMSFLILLTKLSTCINKMISWTVLSNMSWMRTAIFNSESFPNAHNISVCNSHNVIQITTCTDLVKHFCCLVWTGQNLKKINQARKGQNSPFFYISNTLVWAFCASFLFLPQSDSTCDLLLNRHTTTLNLFVSYNREMNCC